MKLSPILAFMSDSIDSLKTEIAGTTDSLEKAELLVRLGATLDQAHLYQESLDAFKQAIEVDPDSAIDNEAYLRAAIAAYQIEDFKQSVDYFKHPLPLHLELTEQIEWTYLRGNAYARAGFLDESFKHYTQAMLLLINVPNPERQEFIDRITRTVNYVIDLHRKTR